MNRSGCVYNVSAAKIMHDLPSYSDLDCAKRLLRFEDARGYRYLSNLPLRQQIGKVKTLRRARHVESLEKWIVERETQVSFAEVPEDVRPSAISEAQTKRAALHSALSLAVAISKTARRMKKRILHPKRFFAKPSTVSSLNDAPEFFECEMQSKKSPGLLDGFVEFLYTPSQHLNDDHVLEDVEATEAFETPKTVNDLTGRIMREVVI